MNDDKKNKLITELSDKDLKDLEIKLQIEYSENNLSDIKHMGHLFRHLKQQQINILSDETILIVNKTFNLNFKKTI